MQLPDAITSFPRTSERSAWLALSLAALYALGPLKII
jgi:hypothetical protein